MIRNGFLQIEGEDLPAEIQRLEDTDTGPVFEIIVAEGDQYHMARVRLDTTKQQIYPGAIFSQYRNEVSALYCRGPEPDVWEVDRKAVHTFAIVDDVVDDYAQISFRMQTINYDHATQTTFHGRTEIYAP
jgi:hypothetical protein